MEEKVESKKIFDAIMCDNALSVLMINIYSLSKDEKQIIISNYDDKKYSHKCFLVMASYVQTLDGYPIVFQKSLIPYLFLKIKYGKKYNIQRAKKNKISINVEEQIKHIEKYFELNEEIYKQIYKNYFERKK
jgi:hypothetical protein